MGVQASKKKNQPPYAMLPDNRYRVLYEVDPEVISFDPKQSYAICIGMDRLEGMPEQSLGPLVVSDCKSLAEACTKYLRIPGDRVKQLVASEDSSCLFTKAGLSTLLVDCARSAHVEEEGILVITFSGHGTTVVKDDTEQAVLPLINHTMERPEYLDGKDISQCVQKAKFCGKNVLLVLDCCFSGGIAEWLQCNEGGEVFRIIAACFAYQTSIQLNPLDHSVFAYFLLDALRRRQGISEPDQEQQEGMSDSKVHLQLHDIFTHIRDSSWALSALYVKYNKATHSLQGFTMVPVVTSTLQRTTSEEDMLDAVETTDGLYEGSDEQGRLHFLQKQWKSFRKVREHRLPQNSYKWLRDQAKPNGPLATLHEQGHLVGRVLQATICALSNSVASIHLYEKNPWNGRARLFIIDMSEIIRVVESASGGEQVTVGHKAVREALTYYFAAYKNAAWPDRNELKSLDYLLAEDLQTAHEGESTDGLVSAEAACSRHVHTHTHTHTTTHTHTHTHTPNMMSTHDAMNCTLYQPFCFFSTVYLCTDQWRLRRA